MPEFLKLVPPDEALKTFLAAIPESDSQRAELIQTEQGFGRVLVEDVIATDSLPAFDRTTVDGYAVRAADTFGASASRHAPSRPAWTGASSSSTPTGTATGKRARGS